MYSPQLVFPMFAMVLLTFTIVIRLLRARIASVKQGTVKTSFYRLYQGEIEPEAAAKLTRHFTNLFEAPVLFYVACVAAMSLNIASLSFLILAWAYVFARIAHTIVHTGKNRLRNRIYAYFSSWIILLIMWASLVVQVALTR